MTHERAHSDLETALTGKNPDARGMLHGRTLAIGAVVVAAVAVAGAIFLSSLVDQRYADVRAEAQKRFEIAVQGRRDVLGTWIEGRRSLARRFADNPLVRLFASEHAADDSAGGGAATVPELPHMQVAIDELVRSAELAGAYLLSRNGRLLLSSTDAAPFNDTRRESAGEIMAGDDAGNIGVRSQADALTLDVSVPVQALQLPPGERARPTVGAMIVAAPVAGILPELLSPLPFAEADSRLRLLTAGSDGAFDILRTLETTPAPALGPHLDGDASTLPFAERTDASGRAVFSHGVRAEGTNFWIVKEASADEVLAPATAYRTVAYSIGALVLLVLGGGFVALHLVQRGSANRALADQYRQLAERIGAQRQLLDNMGGAIRELIGVRGLDGAYVYVNDAFASAMRRPKAAIIGKSDTALFGDGALEELARLDAEVLRTDAPIGGRFVDEKDGSRRLYRISKTPMRNTDGETVGIVSVAHDISEAVAMRAREQKMVQNTITVLAQAMEHADPYLAGHSRRVADAAAAVAEELALPDDMKHVIEIAAQLSQVGKMSIPAEIRGKEGRLTDEELAEMRRHVEHADAALRDFDMPDAVVRAVTQLNERGDGSGYPGGLKLEEIDVPGRILAIADVFVARTSPRSYRPKISAEEALRVLEQNPAKYDARIVRALRHYVERAGGQARPGQENRDARRSAK